MFVKKYISSVLSLLLLLIISINAQAIMQFVREGLIICYKSIIPSLYVFMVLANYISQGNIMFFSLPLWWYSYLMKIKDKRYSAYLLLSLIGGFAVGANFIKKLEQSGYEQNALDVISVSMINNSFSFCLFAVGIGYLGNPRLGIMLFTALTCASLITAFVLSFFIEYNIVSSCIHTENSQKNFVFAVNSAVQSILSICGFVIIFYCVCEVISLYVYEYEILSIVSSIIMEVTSGCIKIINIYGKNIYLLCICLSFLPVSTLCQVYYFTKNKGIISTLVISRLIHTPLSLLILSLLINIFPVAAAAGSMISLKIKAFQNSAEISSTMFLLTILFLTITDHSRLFTKNKF